MSRIKRSLSMKLGLSIVLMAIPIFILAMSILLLQSRQFILKEGSEHATSVLNTALQRARSFMGTVETATSSNLWLINENLDPDSLQSISRRIVQLNRNVYGCSISLEPDVFPQMEKGKACWIDPYDEDNDHTLNPIESLSSYCRPIKKDGQTIGVITSDLSFGQLAEAINAADFPYPNAYFMLLGADGRYFIHPDTTRFYKTIFTDKDPGQHSDLIALGHEMTAGNQGEMHVKINGEVCHVCYSPVPGTDWSLALIFPDSEILKGYKLLVHVVSAIIILGLLFILWLCYRTVKQTISPLNQLLDISQKIADGHYDEVIPHSDREDAIGQLQNSFATMQQSLDNHMSSIRQATEETRRRNEELAQAMKQAEEGIRQKNLFMQHVSHQIRTPLNIIMGFAEVLGERDSALSKEEQASISEMMKHNASHLGRMVLMLFDSSETGATEELTKKRNEWVLCNEVAQESIYFIGSRFPDKSIVFETELSDDFHIQGNHMALFRTICELLNNSAKYSEGDKILLRVFQKDTKVCFVVEDKGPGLPEGSLDQLVKPFVKVDDLSEGLGLGLPLVKRHAVSLGGDLFLDTNYHDGCRFIVELPQ